MSVNVTDPPPDSDSQGWEAFAIFSFLMFLSALIVVTNSLILVAFYKEKQLRTYSNQYIINITISDLLVGLVFMPLRSTIQLNNGAWPFGELSGIFFQGLQSAFLSVSVLTVIAICLDRYFAVFFPLRHLRWKSHRKALVINICCWLLSFSFWFPMFTIWDLVDPTGLSNTARGFAVPNIVINFPAKMVVIVFRLFFPFLSMSVLYAQIWCRIRKRGNKRISEKFENASSQIGGVSFAGRGEHSNVEKNKTDRDNNNLNLRHVTGAETLDVCHVCGNTGKGVALATNEHAYAVNMAFEDGESIERSPTVTGVKDVGQDDPETHPQNPSTLTGRSLTSSWPTQRGPRKISSGSGSKAVRTLTFIIVIFFLTWSPNCLSLFLSYAQRTITGFPEAARLVTYTNSLLNPLAYPLAQPLLRVTLQKIMCAKCRGK